MSRQIPLHTGLTAALLLALGGCATNQPTLHRLDAMNQRLNALETKVQSGDSTARSEAGSAQTKTADLAHRIGALEAKLQHLQGELVHQNGEQRAQLGQLSQDETGLRQSMARVSKRLDQADGRLKAVEARGQETVKQNAGLQAALPPLRDKVAEQEKQIQDLAPRLARVESGLQSLGTQARETATRTAGLQNELPAMHDQLAQSGGQVDSLSSRLARLEQRLAQAERTAQEALDLANGDERAFRGKMLFSVTLHDDKTLFPINSPDLGQGDISVLDGLVERLKPLDKHYHLVIEGHTDAYGSDDNQYELGRARAEVVKRYLNEKEGIPLARMSVISFGAADALSGYGHSNRRIVVQVMQ